MIARVAFQLAQRKKKRAPEGTRFDETPATLMSNRMSELRKNWMPDRDAGLLKTLDAGMRKRRPE